MNLQNLVEQADVPPVTRKDTSTKIAGPSKTHNGNQQVGGLYVC